MPDVLDENGLQVKTKTELLADITPKLQLIYGSDINISFNSPDGQVIDIFCQAGVDLREILLKVYNSFNPNLAYGRILDQRVALNNITRKQGTYTITFVTLTVDRALSLVGLDDEDQTLNPTVENLYTVKDDAGNEFYLIDSYSPPTAGTYVLTFRAAKLGRVETLLNTITTAVTVIPGVTSINNPNPYYQLGINEESDISLRIRNKASTTINALGPLDALEASLNNLDEVITASCYENDTNSVDADGIPAHGIWCIVEGGTDEDIGTTIYRKRIMGVPTKGSESYVVNRVFGSSYTANFDRPIEQDLYIKFSLSLPGGFFDEDGIKSLIVQNVFWKTGKDADSSTVTAYLKSLNENYVISNMEISDDDITYVEVLSTTNKQYKFVNATARITIL